MMLIPLTTFNAKLRRGLGSLGILLAALFSLGSITHAAIDENINKGIWRLLYGVTATQAGDPVFLAGDSDGDGVSNQSELDAGTNPFDRNAVLRVTTLTTTTTTVSLTFPTRNKKLYVVQASNSLTTPAWANLSPTVQVAGDGANKTLVAPRASGTFFRILAQDVDSDNDTVSDWAEQVLGLGLTNSTSNGTLDVNGVPVTDGSYVSSQIAAQGKVTIAALDSSAEQPAVSGGPATNTGLIRITRLGFTQFMGALTVNHVAGGTGTANTDFDALPASSSFSAAVAVKDIVVVPRFNASRVNTVSAMLTLSASSSYTISGQGFAAVIIKPTTAASGTGLLASYYDTSSGNYLDAANFGQAGTYVYTRNADTLTGSIVVTYTGTAISGLVVGNQVKLSFTSSTLAVAPYQHANYPVTAVGANNFTCSISNTVALPLSGSGSTNLSVQSFVHPPVVQRVDSTVNFDWGYGTPNGITITEAGVNTNRPDNYSDVFETYLNPTTAGDYTFQLDADDKARVLLDINRNGVFDLPAEEIVEHNWTTATPVGTFKVGNPITLAVPSTPTGATGRYKMRVEHVETTGDARCRLQWKIAGGTFGNISQTNQYTHTQASTYSSTTGTVTVTPTGGHTLAVGNTVSLWFTSGGLFAQATNYNNSSTVATVNGTTSFTVAIAGAPTTTGSCYISNINSTTTGVLNQTWANTTFTGGPGRVGVDGAVTVGNNGIWGSGTPAVGQINPDTFSARWTGQVQPQFSEDYTFVVQADDGCKMYLNGQLQALKTAPSTSLANSTYAYDSTTGDVIVTYTNLAVVPDSFAVGETVRVDPTSGNLSHLVNATYTYNGTTGDTVVNYAGLTNILANGFAIGQTVYLDPVGGTLNPLGSLPYVITAATANTFTVNFGTGVYATDNTNASITISDVQDMVVTAANSNSFTLHYGSGRYATGPGNINVEVVNKVLKDWSSMGNERYVRIPMVAGVRYDIQLESYENTSYARAQLSWYSASQPKQIIPSERLYPSSGPLAGGGLVSSSSASAVTGGAFSYTIGGSNGGTITISNNPAWLSLAGNVLSGTPPAGSAGDYQVIITVTNANGVGTSVLNIHVDQNTGGVTREFWNGVTGSGVAVIPVNNPPSGTATLTSLTAPTNFGDNYGTRIRGYITAPVTGNYYFWLASSDASQLWISNDSEPVNKLLRAEITAGSTTPLNWATADKTAWLALEAGKKYYIEVLHKAGTGTGDNLAIGWLKPGQTGTVPSEVVPGPVLSRYYDTPALANPGTLYIASMLSQGGATTTGVGNSTLRLSPDESVAYMTRSWGGLTGAITSEHIHVDPYLGNPSAIVFDIDTPATAGDGMITNPSDPNYTGTNPQTATYKWTILGVGPLTAADIREIIKEGKAYINLHTAMYPSGEIRGNYTLAVGSRTFTPPPAPASWADDHNTDVGAVRFLHQATYGANLADVAALKGMASYSAWIDDQFTKPATTQLAEVLARELSDAQGGSMLDESLTYNAWWRNSMTGADQLRQRIAFALSQIVVVSATGPLADRADALSYYYDKLATDAFGNFRDILEDVTLTPTMGRYLDMLRNDKPDLSLGRGPNENYAREIMQLFSIGLYRLWPDGSLILNSKDAPIDTYTQREIVGVAHVFTGWDYGYNGVFRTGLGAPTDWMRQMRETPARHFTGNKRVLDNEVLPGLQTLGNQPLDPYAVHTANQFNDPAYQALPGQELDAVHNQLFNHPNVGPFICRQLIQRMVTSNPSRDYLYRVVQAFNNNGSGVRGDMKAVIKAILLDYEARSATAAAKPDFGKQREPVLRVTQAARAFRPAAASGTYSQTNSHVINVTMANKLAGGNNVFLEFPGTFTPGDTTPTTESYAVLSTPAPTATTFSVNAKGWIGVSTSNGTLNNGASAPYAQIAGSSTLTVTLASHWLPNGAKAYLDFAMTSTGPAVTSGVFTITGSDATDTVAGTAFSITMGDTTARTGFVRLVRFQGSYVVTDSNLASPQNKRITLDTIHGGIANHHLNVGDHVWLNFTSGNPIATDGEFVVEAVPDKNTFTVLTTGIGNVNNNGIFMFPLLSQPKTRSGNVGAPPSTFILNSTNGDFDQSPLNSPTVFNFFLPEYKYPGTLASQGMTTPEFQITTESSVIRQTNFFTNGMLNPGNTTGISSFKSGSNALVLDLSPWMANATDLGLGAGAVQTEAWTSNANLPSLIDDLQILLTGNLLPAAAKTSIQNFLLKTITNVTVGNPTTITSPGHGLATSDQITIYGVGGGTPSLNGTVYTVTVVDANTFTIPVNVTVAPTPAQLATASYSFIQYNNATPSDTNKRDRLRAIVHFILASPDYTIQR
jgi:uncharacterized protein (DUF1800 family)